MGTQNHVLHQISGDDSGLNVIYYQRGLISMSVVTAEVLLPVSCAQSALEEQQMLKSLIAVRHGVWK